MTLAAAENPRAVLGHNNPPPDEAADILFIDARLVKEAASYIQFRFQHQRLEAFLSKRKAGLPLGFRRVLCYCLKGLVSTDALAEILSLNRKTLSEDQQSVELWTEEDDAFAEDVENLRMAVMGHIAVNLERFVQTLSAFMADEPDRRRDEKKRRALLAADKRALAEKEREKSQEKISNLKSLKVALNNKPNAEAILAHHAGARETARRISERALAVLDAVQRADAKVAGRCATSALDRQGLAECIATGIARVAEPHLSKNPDPAIGPTAFGARVYLEAISQKRITLEKKKRG